MQIKQIPVLQDNFIYVLYDEQRRTAAVVDPATSHEVISFLEKENLIR